MTSELIDMLVNIVSEYEINEKEVEFVFLMEKKRWKMNGKFQPKTENKTEKQKRKMSRKTK